MTGVQTCALPIWAINLPVPVQADKIKADYKRGVLEVTLPKAEEARTKEIQIDVG